MSQIYLRPGLETCSRLEAVRDEDRPPVAPNPTLTAALDAAGVSDGGARLAVQVAAGDYARAVQATERVAGVNRDLDQTQHNRRLCAEHGELVGAIRHNNAGPARD